MFPLRYPLDLISKESFNYLCLAILRNKISPNVRLVSAVGKDGGRDALLDGKCTTGLYSNHSYWIFQFKHYQGDLSSSRSKAHADFRREASATLASYPRSDAYFFLTSVPFSGTPGTGLFDQIANACAEIRQQSRKYIEFWDGLQLCTFIDEHPTSYQVFINSVSPIVIPRFLPSSAKELGIKPTLKIQTIDFEQPLSTSILEWLFPLQGTVLGPGGTSPMAEAISEGQFRTLLHLNRIIFNTASVKKPKDYADPLQRAYLWSQLLTAYSAIQLGNATEGVRLLRRLEAMVSPEQAIEITAWIYNLLSIAAGKLGNEANSRRFGATAVTLAQRSGLHWLSTAVQLRLLHRASWNRWESGGRFEHSLFEDTLQSQLLGARYVGNAEKHSLEIMKYAFQTLHYSWDPQTQAVASTNGHIALQLLAGQFDRDEAARMVSELGRIKASAGNFAEAVQYLKQAAQLRSETGNLARLRYDLSWLASSYLKLQDIPAAAICTRAALALHAQLYERQNTDSSLLRRLHDIGKQSFLNKRGSFSPLTKNLDLLSQASGIDAIWWELNLESL